MTFSLPTWLVIAIFLLGMAAGLLSVVAYAYFDEWYFQQPWRNRR